MDAHNFASRKAVAIVGGGLTGGAIAYHLATRALPADITVFEPRADLGRGLAYGTDDPAHRINVPAAKMSLLPGDESHFVDWINTNDAIAEDPFALADDGQIYVRRSLFGRYVTAHIQPLLNAGKIRHEQTEIVAIARGRNGRWILETRTGRRHEADIVVLATTHPPPGVPDLLLEKLDGDRRLIKDATVPDVLEDLPPSARIVIVGTGLTMADVVASLDRKQHEGPIYAFSRRGLIARGHARQAHAPYGEFTAAPATALGLLRTIRSTIDAARRNGIPWQPVIDAVRAQASTFWPNLPLEERKRIVDRLRPYWDVHRFRIAPQLEELLARRIGEGKLTIRAASLAGVTATPNTVEITVRLRGSASLETIAADYVIVTTGPAHGSAIETQPHLAALASAGVIEADATKLGISCDRRGHAITPNGEKMADLLIAGPLARGTFGELMGLPQVTAYAQTIADEAFEQLSPAKAARPVVAAR